MREKKGYQPKIIYLATLSFTFERNSYEEKIKPFLDRQKLRFLTLDLPIKNAQSKLSG